ncbi:50S ribosomal protein L2 [Rickettsia endosymbiont of Cardiosporidium cionae]|uniref:50S ribosomal protein L2 n=1 Tax=Rickettsia endosymbiont of Cardiosporidium cionae TaxID=2777155 RepID=UPI0018960500|nr:50S ribosomal protein L2 [Rickettsia endosymbiont of Cardiosporidium cionae]KAF8818199.1 50S ribosomal protein L2 [Rickettsia endosymbiont of Cardiosporidium cionae]
MALIKYNPINSSTRGVVLVNKRSLWKGSPEKFLTVGIAKSGGRNNLGRITSWHKGGGNKRKYRFIDFKRQKTDVLGTVRRLEYDPNRTAFIALVQYQDDTCSYILAPDGLSEGDQVISGENVDIKIGNSMTLENIPVGVDIHNIEMIPGKGGQIARSAGSYACIVAKDNGYAQLKLPSGSRRLVHLCCRASIGVLSNIDQCNVNLGKAGRNRWLGKKPVVRGVAMNPVDHPHGGGEGKTSGGRHPVTPWGKMTKGKKTRNNKLTDKFIIKKRNS